MKRSITNFLVDAVSALVMFGMIVTGLVMRYTLPPGSGRSRLLWGLGRHDWGDIHFWLAVAVAALVVVHVALHWQWVCGMVWRTFRRGEGAKLPLSTLTKNLTGVGFLLGVVAICAGFLYLAQSNVREVSGPGKGGEGEQVRPAESDGQRFPGQRPEQVMVLAEDSPIRGSMTLAEIANAKSISVETLRKRLQFPATIPSDERMGRLCKEYGLTMPEARKRIETLSK